MKATGDKATVQQHASQQHEGDAFFAPENDNAFFKAKESDNTSTRFFPQGNGGFFGGPAVQAKVATPPPPPTLQLAGGPELGQEEVSEPLEQQINAKKGTGAPLPPDTQNEMEDAFGADFSGVKVHTDEKAQDMNKALGANAFTHGSDIYFGEGKFEPGTREGKRLLAHELTHTVQQGSGGDVQPEMIQASFIRDLIDELVTLAGRVGIDIGEIVDNIPGYTLFSYIIEYDVIRGREVERDGRNLIRGLMGLIPGGNLLYNKLNEFGIIDQAFGWVEEQLSSLNISMGRIEGALSAAWDQMGWTEGVSGNLQILRNHFTPILNDIETFADRSVDQLLEFVKEALIRPMVDFLEERSDAVQLAYKILGRRFPLEDPVEASTAEILEDFLVLIGRETEVEQMRERGTLQETADWIDTQLSRFFSLVGRFQTLMGRVWEAFSLETLEDIPGTFQGIFDEFMVLLNDFFDFAWEVAAKVLEIVKNALLSWLDSFAANIPGFTLLTVIIERNPLTGQPVQRSVENLIRGFMGLVSGGEEKFQELQESGVVPRAAAQIEELMSELGISWSFISQLFTDVWDSMSIEDLIDPLATFDRVLDQFGEPIARLFIFVVRVVQIVVELILEIMGIPPELVAGIITNAMSAFEDIKNDPVGFLLNLMDAIKEGFLNFLGNIGMHLLSGIQNWLFGTLADAGIEMPTDFSIRSMLGMAMDILGVTVDNILDRLALRIGEERVAQIRSVLDTLSGIWAFVRDVIERGPIAIWEYVQDQLSNLWDIIQEGIMGFIQENVVEQAIGWLMSFLDVTGIMPVIRGVQTVFNAISTFVEKLREILEIVSSFVAGVADIARGNIATAAQFLEQALADGIPVAIGFLARQLGLGDISEKIEEMIEAAREKINEAIDWLIDMALRAGTAFLNAMGLGGESEAENSTTHENADDGLSISEPYSMENQSHTISIEDGSELMIASRPTSFNQFLNGLEEGIGDDPNKLEALERAREIVTVINGINREPNPERDEAILQDKRTRIRNQMSLLWEQTTILLGDMGSLATGDSREDPIPFTWYKDINNQSLYPPITIMGERFDIYDNFQVFEHPQAPGVSIELGIDRSPVESGGFGVTTGSVIKKIRGRRGDKTAQFRYILQQLGAHVGPYEIDDAGVHIDHVLDVNFGGEDSFSNLWPYDSSANSSAGSRQNAQIVTYQDSETGQLRAASANDPSLYNKFFIVESIEN